MNIVAQTLAGITVELQVQPADAVLHIKALIEAKAGIAVQRQRLVVGCKELKDDQHVSDYDIQEGTRVYIILRIPATTAAQAPVQAPVQAQAQAK